MGKCQSRGKEINSEAYGKEEVGNVMCNIHGDSHVGEMEAVAEPDQANGDEVVGNELTEIFPRLFKHKEQDDQLLCPVASLEQVICFDKTVIGSVREAFVHGRSVEVPDRGARHDPEPKRTIETKIESGIGLLHET